MTFRRSIALAVLGLLLLAPPLASPAAAQTTARIDLEAQTLFVHEDPAEIVLRVSGAPADARLRFTIYDDPVLTRAEVREQHRTPPTSGDRIANFECTLDGDCRDQASLISGPDGILTVTLDDDVIGEALRGQEGALPFVVRLLTDDGTELDQLATSLIVLDDTGEDPDDPRVRVAFTSRIIVPVARQSDLRNVPDLDALDAATASLESFPDLAVTTDIRPETLDALAQTEPARLDELLDLLGGRPLLRNPWVDMDEEAWRLAGESDQVISQYARGDETVAEIIGTPPTGLVRLDADAVPDTLTLLRSAGATAVVVDDTQLSTATRAATATQPFQLLDANGVAMAALRYDEDLHDTLTLSDPELAAYHALAELILLAEESPTDQSVLLDLDRVDAEALVRMIEGIGTRRSLSITDVANLLERELARVDGEALRGELVAEPAPDVSDLAGELESSVAGVATVARMYEPEIDFLVPLVDQLQAAVSTDLSPETARDYVDRVNDEVSALSGGITIEDGERITLTDRRTDLPLTIANGQALPLNVEILLTAEKIRFPDGDRLTLTLEPGVTTITIPVETLASGDARVTATVVSPGGFFELSSGTVDIRSTAISGLGLVISIAALIVLGVWWIRTIRRVRRNRATATVSATLDESPETSDDTAAAEPPTEGET